MSTAVVKDCYATMWSYGEICVRCNCCGRFDKDKGKIIKAKLLYAKEQLKGAKHFNGWGNTEEIRMIQEENVKSSIEYWKKGIKELTKQKLGELDKPR